METTRSTLITAVASIGCAMACSSGSSAATQPNQLTVGDYDLVTDSVDGDCNLTQVITYSDERVGNTRPVYVASVSDVSIKFEICGPDNKRASCASLVDYDFSATRTQDTFTADAKADFYGCAVYGTKHVDGMITGDGQATLVWTLSHPGSTSQPACKCNSTVHQRLSRVSK